MIPGAIMWCEICANAPAEGILEVIYTGDIEITPMHACAKCVKELDDDDWI